jgi:AcrR family transcriptional regulator
VQQVMNRTERRRLETHEDLLEATKDLLLERGPRDLSARLIAKRADHAAATFYNHFADVDAAVLEAITPSAQWAAEWGQRVTDAEDIPAEVCAFIADFLVRLETEEGTLWAVAHAANRPLLEVVLDDTAAVAFADQDPVTGPAGDGCCSNMGRPQASQMVNHLMAVCGRMYGGRPVDEAARRRIARTLHAVFWDDGDVVAERTETSLTRYDEARGAVR